MHRYPRMTMNKKKRSLLHIEHDSLTHTRYMKNMDLFGTGGCIHKTNYHREQKKKMGKLKSDRIFIHREKCFE